MQENAVYRYVARFGQAVFETGWLILIAQRPSKADRSVCTAVVWAARPFTTKRELLVKNYSNKTHSETNSKVERVVLNALVSNVVPAPNLLAPSAILLPSVRAGLAFSGEDDPPLA